MTQVGLTTTKEFGTGEFMEIENILMFCGELKLETRISIAFSFIRTNQYQRLQVVKDLNLHYLTNQEE